MSDVTRADIFQRVKEKTEAFVRFSTVAGRKGSFDLARDVRGFAVKLYTKEGNWDIVGNNIPAERYTQVARRRRMARADMGISFARDEQRTNLPIWLV